MMDKIIGRFTPKENNPHEEFEVVEQWASCKISEEVSERVGKKVGGEDFHIYTEYWDYVEYES